MTTTHIDGSPIEDRLAIGTLYLEGYAPLAEHLKARLDVPEPLDHCARLTVDFRKLMLGSASPAQAQVTSGDMPQDETCPAGSIR